MYNLKPGSAEEMFADIIWNNEPVSSSELAKIVLQQMHWQKTTCFTVLKRLINKGIFKNENGIVTSLIKREQYYSLCGQQCVDTYFSGSLPLFISSFISGRKLSEEEIKALRELIDNYEGEKDV